MQQIPDQSLPLCVLRCSKTKIRQLKQFELKNNVCCSIETQHIKETDILQRSYKTGKVRDRNTIFRKKENDCVTSKEYIFTQLITSVIESIMNHAKGVWEIPKKITFQLVKRMSVRAKIQICAKEKNWSTLVMPH